MNEAKPEKDTDITQAEPKAESEPDDGFAKWGITYLDLD